MPTVTGLTAARMAQIEAASIVDAELLGDDLVLSKNDGTPINVGNVKGPPGPDTEAAIEPLQDHLNRLRVHASDFGGYWDGESHPLSDDYLTLGNAQAFYPFVTSLTQQADWAALIKAIQAVKPNAASLNNRAGLVYLEGRPYIGDTVEVVGGVVVDGASSGSTICTGPTGFAGPFFDLSLHDGIGHFGFSGQGWRPGLKSISIQDNDMPTSEELQAGIADTRQVVDGVWAHDADGVILEDVLVEMIAGYHFKFGPTLRENSIRDCRSYWGGYQPDDKAAVIFENDAGDENNCIDFFGLHVGYAAYVSVDFNAVGGVPALDQQGSRFIQFFGGQIEMGGYGTALAPLKISGNAPPYDNIRIRSGRDISFRGTEIGGAPIAGKALIKLEGNATASLGTIELDCPINNVGAGISIDCDKVGLLKVKGGSLFATTNTDADHLRTTVNTGLVIWDPAVQGDSTGDGDLGMDLVYDWKKIKRNKPRKEALALASGVTDQGGGFAPPSARLERNGRVTLEGLVGGGSAALGSEICTVPFPPAYNKRFVIEGNTGPVHVQINNTTGLMIIYSNPAWSAASLCLDSIEYWID